MIYHRIINSVKRTRQVENSIDISFSSLGAKVTALTLRGQTIPGGSLFQATSAIHWLITFGHPLPLGRTSMPTVGADRLDESESRCFTTEPTCSLHRLLERVAGRAPLEVNNPVLYGTPWRGHAIDESNSRYVPFPRGSTPRHRTSPQFHAPAKLPSRPAEFSSPNGPILPSLPSPWSCCASQPSQNSLWRTPLPLNSAHSSPALS